MNFEHFKDLQNYIYDMVREKNQLVLNQILVVDSWEPNESFYDKVYYGITENIIWKLMDFIPDEVFRFPQLTALSITNCGLQNLPPKIQELHNLVSLDLSGNQISSIPAEIGQLTNLTYLNLSNNKLENLPREIRNLSSLKILDLSGNLPLTLPSQIELPTCLEKLIWAGDN